MFWKTPQFKSIQEKWYKALEEDGFHDIEKNENILKNHSVIITKANNNVVRQSALQEYYLLLEQNVRNRITEFDDSIDLFVMYYISQGKKIEEIRKMLLSKDFKISRFTIYKIRNHYESLWGIKCKKKNKKN